MARSAGQPTIAILGGGVGGTILANLLARELPRFGPKARGGEEMQEAPLGEKRIQPKR